MSNIYTDMFIEQMWDKHSPEYLKWCNANNWQADLSDFWIYLEEHDLIPADIYES